MLSKDNNYSRQLQSNYSSDGGVTKFGSGTLIPPGMTPLPTRLNYHLTSFPSSNLIFNLKKKKNTFNKLSLINLITLRLHASSTSTSCKLI